MEIFDIDYKLKKLIYVLLKSYCTNRFGKSRFNRGYPKFRINNNLKNIYGIYDFIKNEISINLKLHTNKIELIDTILHEYRHYKQKMPLNTKKNLYRIENDAVKFSEKETPLALEFIDECLNNYNHHFNKKRYKNNNGRKKIIKKSFNRDIW